MDIINKLRTVTKKQVFETVFCSTVLGSIILWLIGLFYMGQASVQYDFAGAQRKIAMAEKYGDIEWRKDE